MLQPLCLWISRVLLTLMLKFLSSVNKLLSLILSSLNSKINVIILHIPQSVNPKFSPKRPKNLRNIPSAVRLLLTQLKVGNKRADDFFLFNKLYFLFRSFSCPLFSFSSSSLIANIINCIILGVSLSYSSSVVPSSFGLIFYCIRKIIFNNFHSTISFHQFVVNMMIIQLNLCTMYNTYTTTTKIEEEATIICQHNNKNKVRFLLIYVHVGENE
mmetsp:Transcript_2418/g.3263  ORF Transcript_2418/g.3263 Transcript_2418/m.3263 type:complete len:214 (+) Transcript_2418:999-1640(+)